MPRSTLPQNYTLNTGNSYEDFENIGDWVLGNGANGNIQANTVNFLTGSKSVKMSVTTAGSYITMDKTISLKMADKKVFKLGIYLHTLPTDLSIVGLCFTSASNWAKYFEYDFIGSGLHPGWNIVTAALRDFTNTGGESWDNTMIRMRFRLQAMSGCTPAVSIDNLTEKFDGLSRCVIMFDDGYSSIYSQGYSYMDSKGLKGTAYVVPTLVGTGGYMTLAQLTEMYSKGWAIANHTYDHTDLSTLATQADIGAKVSQCRDWLENNGFTRASKHVAYPVGGYNDLVLAAMTEQGMVTGRTISPRIQCAPPENNYLLHCRMVGTSFNLANAKTLIDAACNTGSTVMILFHQLVTTPSANTDWSISDFQSIVDYIIASGIKCVTIDEWYQGLTNPRYRSLPLNRPAV